MTPEEFVARLDGVKPSGPGRWMARCPAHEDRTASLSVGVGTDGRVLVNCHASCDVDAILVALGLASADLFEKPKANGHRPSTVAEYHYTDEQGKTLFVVVRKSNKQFPQKQPDGNGGWIHNLKGVRRVLYRLPELIDGVACNRWIFIVEGEKDVATLVSAGLVATCNAGGASKKPGEKKWLPEYAQYLTGARVVIIPDNDEPGRAHAETVAASLVGVAEVVKVLELDGLGDKEDVSDWFARGGTKQRLQELVLAASEATTGPIGPVVELSALLDDLLATLMRYVIFPSPAFAHAVVLWIAATHAQEAWQHATRLVVKSPEKRCGKSRLLDLIEATCSRPLVTVNASVAAIYRSIDPDDPPTLIFDEADSIFGKRNVEGTEELRGLLNAGFQRNRPALRCVGPQQTPTEFATFAMCALAAIGDVIPDTVTDRAVSGTMRRRAPAETVAGYRNKRDAAPLRELGERLGAVVRDHVDELEHAEPIMPVEDRAADTWEPLVAIRGLRRWFMAGARAVGGHDIDG